MTTDDFLELVRDAYATAGWGEGVDLADLDALDLDELDDVTARLIALRSALRQLQEGVDRRIGDYLQGGRGRLGEWVYRHVPEHSERIAEPDRLVDWLADDWPHVVPVTASTRLRKGGLKAVLEKRGMSWAAFYDTFMHVTVGETKVERLPVDKVKSLQGVPHGVILRNDD